MVLRSGSAVDGVARGRGEPSARECLVVGDLTVDLTVGEVGYRGRVLALSAREIELLARMVCRPGAVVAVSPIGDVWRLAARLRGALGLSPDQGPHLARVSGGWTFVPRADREGPVLSGF